MSNMRWASIRCFSTMRETGEADEALLNGEAYSIEGQGADSKRQAAGLRRACITLARDRASKSLHFEIEVSGRHIFVKVSRSSHGRLRACDNRGRRKTCDLHMLPTTIRPSELQPSRVGSNESASTDKRLHHGVTER